MIHTGGYHESSSCSAASPETFATTTMPTNTITTTTITTTTPTPIATTINTNIECEDAGLVNGPNAAVYPSMSVNVSMNMTMHGYGPPDSNGINLQPSQVSFPKALHKIALFFIYLSYNNNLIIYNNIELIFRCNGRQPPIIPLSMFCIRHF